MPPLGPAQADQPVRLPHERGTQDVVDAAVHDRDGSPVELLHVDNARHVDPCRTDEEASGLEQHAEPYQSRVGRPALRGGSQARPQSVEIERLVGVGVRDAETAARVDEAEWQADGGHDVGGEGDRVGDVLDEGIGVAEVGGAEGVDAQQVEMRTTGRRSGRSPADRRSPCRTCRRPRRR